MKKLTYLISSLTVLALACALGAALTGCSSKGSAGQTSTREIATATYPAPVAADDFETQFQIDEDNPVDLDFTLSVTDFSYESASQILRSSLAEDGVVNANYSPVSLYYALALCGTGANGQTQDEILSLLGTDDPEFLAQQAGNLYRQLYTDDGFTSLTLANSLWVAEDTDFADGYLEMASEQLYASAWLTEFGTAEADEAIAQWISDQTGGTLSPTIQTNPDEVILILNTVYFKSPWTEPFSADDIETDTFHAASGDKDADFLVTTEDYATYYDGDGYTRAALGFADGSIIWFVLPDEGVECADLIATPEATASLFTACDHSTARITYHVPKFSFDTERSIAEDLEALGIESAFTSNADFSNMTSASVSISDVIQGTHIALDENGVEASAYTEVMMTMTAEPTVPDEELDFNLNRPFLFLITSPQGIPLFIGVCGDPTV